MHTRTFAAALACLSLLTGCWLAAQDAQLKLPAFADLKEKAVKSVDHHHRAATLGIMGWIMTMTTRTPRS